MNNKNLIPVRHTHALLRPDSIEKMDIDALKIFVNFLASALIVLETIFIRRNWFGIVNLGQLVWENMNIFTRGREALDEIKKLSKPGQAELAAIFAESLDLKNDKLEQQFEKAFDLVSIAYNLYLRGQADTATLIAFVQMQISDFNWKTLIPKVNYELSADDNKLELEVGWKDNDNTAIIVYNTTSTIQDIYQFAREFIDYISDLRPKEAEPPTELQEQPQLQEAEKETTAVVS
ncbi:MAG: hypothetical protein AAF738_07355 [Bacteroidota bacterium]